MNETLPALGVVPVRKGSKGLAGKNIRRLNGIPLYRHAVDQALRIIGRCVITTDIPEILSADLPTGCEVLERDAALAADETPMHLVIDDVIRRLELERETLVLLQATSPLRNDQDVERVMALHATGVHDLVMTVVSTDPGILKYGTVKGDQFVPVSRPEYCFSNRQSLPDIYRPNGAVYAFSANAFSRANHFPFDNMGVVEMPQGRSFDIDTIEDFDNAARVLTEWQLDEGGSRD